MQSQGIAVFSPATATTSCFVTVTDYLDDMFGHFDHGVDDFDVCEGGGVQQLSKKVD